MKQGLVRLLYNFGKRFMGWTLHMIMCVLLCYPVSIRIYYQQGVLFLVNIQVFGLVLCTYEVGDYLILCVLCTEIAHLMHVFHGFFHLVCFKVSYVEFF